MRTEKDKKPNDNEIRVIDASGDSKHYWDSESLDEVKAARQMFTDLTAKNYKCYRMSMTGGKGKVMSKFEPKAGKMIFVPPIVGG